MPTDNNLIDFAKIVQDFGKDLLITFEDKLTNISKDLRIIIDADLTLLNKDVSDPSDPKEETVYSNNYNENPAEYIEMLETAIKNVNNHCSEILPMRFFDLLYKNVDIFDNTDTEQKCYFLPSIDFKELWLEDITDNTRDNIWKYLQLLLFSIINNVNSKSSFGDTAKLFEAIDEGEFKSKLEDTIKGLEHLFTTTTDKTDKTDQDNDKTDKMDQDQDQDQDKTDEGTNNKYNQDFNPDDIHKHINGLMNGKLGKLAQELAEETAKEFNFEGDNIGDVKDVFQTLFKNPQKLMSLVKNVGSKLDEKMKSGDIKESELLEEASAMFNSMKDMPNMNNQMNDLFKNMNIPNLMKNMGMGGGGGGGKFNQGAFNSMMNENMKNSKMRERMKTKLEGRKSASVPTTQAKETVQDNIKNNFDYLFNNSNNKSPDLTDLNNSLQSLVEQMKLNNQPLPPPTLPTSHKKKKKKNNNATNETTATNETNATNATNATN